MKKYDVLKNDLLKFAYNFQKHINNEYYNSQELFVSKQSLLVVYRTCNII